jgi:hypothetical protein
MPERGHTAPDLLYLGGHRSSQIKLILTLLRVEIEPHNLIRIDGEMRIKYGRMDSRLGAYPWMMTLPLSFSFHEQKTLLSRYLYL